MKRGDDAVLARHAMAILQSLGRRPMKDGQPIKDEGEATAALLENIRPILDEDVPLWRRLGVL